MSRLVLRSVTRRYGATEVLRGVDLEIAPGEYLALEGPSGSGKSTLLAGIGLLEAFDGGEYLLDGRDVARLPDAAAARLRNRHFGFVFQHFHLLPHLSAWENVARPLLYAGVPTRQRRERALAALERLGLAHRAGHRPAQLSGGEQQRVAVARALVNDPAVVLADEPTASLPPTQREAVLAVLEELNRAGTTLVVITHDEAVARRARRRLRLEEGRVVGGPGKPPPA